MSSTTTAAVVGGVVALAVSLITAIVSSRTQTRALKQERQRFEAEQQRGLTLRLLEKRLELYPDGFAATEPLRESLLRAHEGEIASGYLTSTMENIEAWRGSRGGLLLSQTSLRRMWELRQAAVWALDQDNPSDDYVLAVLADAGYRVRSAMWGDLRSLFGEEGGINPNEQWTWQPPPDVRSTAERHPASPEVELPDQHEDR